MKRKILFMLSLLSLNAFAETSIEPKGAFGINFGDKISILKVKNEFFVICVRRIATV